MPKYRDEPNVLDRRANGIETPQDVVNRIHGRPGEQARDGAIDELRARQVKHVPIFEIYPDPGQPRRAVPSEIRAHWNGQPEGVPGMMDAWMSWRLKGVSQDEYREASRRLVLGQSGLDYDEPMRPHPVEAGYLKIVEVAAGIYRDGLINPITVAQAGQQYRLETGERRWLAYHLLYLLFEEDRWARIPARLVERPNVWRQALENNARDNLNAIARARQLAILIMDLLGSEQFEPLDAFENEREYYAQVADGEVYRIPRGQTERLLQAMGLKDNSQVRQYRRLLRLPDDVWRVADDENWTENKLRKFIPNDDDTVTGVTVSPSPTADDDLLERDFDRLVRRALKVGQGDRAKVAARLRALADRIERGE